MSIEVEVNLRIPVVKEARKDRNGYPINSATVRFIGELSVPAVPKPGALLHLTTTEGPSLECEVHRADWSEAQNRFIVYCKYAKRSIPVDEYNALLDDPNWKMRPLL